MLYVVIALCALGGMYLFFRFYPPFGGRTLRSVKEKSPQFKDGKFVNQIPTSMDTSFADTVSILRDFMRKGTNRRPSKQLTPERLDVAAHTANTQVTWFGHSAFLLQAKGKTILYDPMFGVSPSPFPALGSKRFSDQLPALPEDLPHIDAVVVSHDHYDHLDYPSVLKLKDKTDMFFVPIGLGAHLRRWGVPAAHITELDWWQEASHHGIKFVCTPARHFSGRTLTDRFATLWASWVIDTGSERLFFSGDSGYGPHYAQIGAKYGPFAMTFMECGQYDRRWANIHMTPEQTVQAHLDLRGKRMVPMHWGAFVLALHAWTDPVNRALAASKKHNVQLVTPKIGERFSVSGPHYPIEKWWTKI
ncbi:MAG TPA: MBL fold metallo-hydrolase [Candidatus Saccharimonadales bacterium]|nr:MBL fold metallo-hydrolase [Candidatus Saccharimonadales bacterium]